METWVWIVIIIFGILVLAGLGVGIYYIYRKKNVPTSFKDLKKANPPKNPNQGDFSFRPASLSSDYAVAMKESDILFQPALISSSAAIPCSNYTWILGSYQNIWSKKLMENVLMNYGSTDIAKSKDSILMVPNNGEPAIVYPPIKTDNYLVSWEYNTDKQTICSTETPNMCLYYQNGGIIAKPLMGLSGEISDDKNFKWITETPKSSCA
ncbi:MAG TPA: hypothetical protein PKD85_05800 [Saprospiraceae bacterium]|nr:hypothetical protein [Saprospiraceae bacterium]